MKKTSNILILIGFTVLSILIIGFFIKMKSHLVSEDTKVTPISKEMHEKWADILGIDDLKVITTELDSLSANVLKLSGNSNYILDPNSTKITVRGYSSLVSQIDSDQTNDSINIGWLRVPTENTNLEGYVSSPEDMRFTIGVKDKESITIYADNGAKITTSGDLNLANFNLTLDGNTDTKINLDAESMTLNLDGKSKCELKGSFDKLIVTNK